MGHKIKSEKKQPSIDFDFCNISSSCDVVYKGRWLTQAGYWFILRFWNSPSVINKYSVAKYFFIICFENLHLGIPSTHTCIIFKTNDKKILSYRIFINNWGGIFILRTLKIRYIPVFCLFTLGRHGNFTAGVTFVSLLKQAKCSQNRKINQ
jgi:hypothetical protein